MGTHFTYLNAHFRKILEQMLIQKCSISQIVKRFGIHRSTVYREIKHNQRYPKPGQRYDLTLRYESYSANNLGTL